MLVLLSSSPPAELVANHVLVQSVALSTELVELVACIKLGVGVLVLLSTPPTVSTKHVPVSCKLVLLAVPSAVLVAEPVELTANHPLVCGGGDAAGRVLQRVYHGSCTVW